MGGKDCMEGKGGMGGGTEFREDMAVVMVEPIVVMLGLLKLLLKLGMLPMLVGAKVDTFLMLTGSCAETAVVAEVDVLLKP